MRYKNEDFLLDIAPLLERLDRGETLFWEEEAKLAAIKVLHGISWKGELPGSIKTMTELEILNLAGTPVSDLSPLGGLRSLKTLSLSGTPVRDLSPLRGLKALKKLYLDYTQVRDLSPLGGTPGPSTAAAEASPS